MNYSSNRIISIFGSIGYFFYYILFTGIVESQTLQNVNIVNRTLIIIEVASQAYNGPALQLISNNSIIIIRLIPLMLAIMLSILVGINISLMNQLRKINGIKSCLFNSKIGVFGFTVSNLASFSYFCCGSAIFLLLVGSTFLARFSTLISSGSIIILAINAYILRKKKNVQHFS